MSSIHLCCLRFKSGGRIGKGIGWPVVAASMPVIRFSGEGKQRDEWGVKRGECGAIYGRGGDTGVVPVRARGGTAAAPSVA
jgi:hypothetical protein